MMVEVLERQAGLRVYVEVQAGKLDRMADTQKLVIVGELDGCRLL